MAHANDTGMLWFVAYRYTVENQNVKHLVQPNTLPAVFPTAAVSPKWLANAQTTAKVTVTILNHRLL
jgi:hypothetical protein